MRSNLNFQSLPIVAVWMAVSLSNGGAQSLGKADVAVEYASPDLVMVQVIRPTGLGTVLEAICKETKLRCEITAQASEISVPPITLVGTWSGVMAKLLEGTKLNYAATDPSASGFGRLLVEVRRSADSSSEARHAQRDPGASLTSQETREFRADMSQEQLSPPNSTSEPPSLSDDEIRRQPVEDSAEVESTLSSPSDSPSLSSAEIQQKEAATWGLILGVIPNPSTVPPGMTALPVGDLNGNLILVPKSQQPLQVLPFPGPDGRPIPITPLPPGNASLNPLPR